VENEFYAEAFGMSRTVFELSLAARYISNGDAFQRAAVYANYFAKDHEAWTNIVAKYYPTTKPQFNANHARLLAKARLIKDVHRWSGKSIKHMAMEDDAFENDPNTGQPFRWEFDYEAVYKWTSHFVHGTVI